MKLKKGFTLIELLLVIAIIGILAAALIVILNPLEQFARGRDSGRISTATQLGKAVESYASAQNGTYPTQGSVWLTTLQSASELKSIPSNPTSNGYTQGCYSIGVSQNGICYETDSTNAIVYMRAEANATSIKAGCTAGQIAWIVWSSADGRTGVTCTGTNVDPAIGVTGLK